MGGSPEVFLAIVKELYRIAAPGCRIVIRAPHPRHDSFISDPTPVRPITADTWRLFDREIAEQVIAAGGSNSPLALYVGVDFELGEESVTLDELYWTQYRRGEIDDAGVQRLLRERNNVARELSFVLRARKSEPSSPSPPSGG